MFVVTLEDAIAVHRAHQQGGDDAALVEVRRRWPGLAERIHRDVLDRVMRLSVQVPTIPTTTYPPGPGSPEGDAIRERELERKRRARERDRERREQYKARQRAP